MSSEAQFISSGDTNDRTTTYENNPASAFLDLDCKRIPYDPDTFRIATSSLSQDPTCVNAFLESIPHSTSMVFHPQPIMPVEHHHLLHQEHLSPLQPGHFEQVPDGSFSSGRLSLQSSSDISAGDASQLAGLPFGFLNSHGALPAPLTTSSSLNSLVPDLTQCHSTLDHYLSCQNTSPNFSYSLQTPLELHSPPEARIGDLSGSSSIEPSGRFRNSTQSLPGHLFDSSELELLSSEEIQLGRDLQTVERSLSACALVDRAPNGYQLLQQPFSPTRLNKRPRSPTLGLDSAPELGEPKLVHQTPVAYQPTVAGFEYQFWQDMDNQSPSPIRPAQATPQTTLKRAKRHRKNKFPPRDRAFQSDQFITPCRSNVLSNNTTYRNIFPPTPESVDRPGNCGQGEGGARSQQDKNAYKMERIRSIERALEAVDTLSEYLSKEASEASVQADKIENTALGSPCHRNSASRLALGSPREFLTLGELGGRLRRRLEVERR